MNEFDARLPYVGQSHCTEQPCEGDAANLGSTLGSFRKIKDAQPRSMNTRRLTERAATVRVAPHEHFSPPSLEVNLFKNVAEFWLQMAKGYAKQ